MAMMKLHPITPEKNAYQDDDLVCYCFGYTRKNIEDDYKNNGFSKILEKITTEKKNKNCRCKVKNPKGR